MEWLNWHQISDFSFFFVVKIATPLEKVTASFPAKPSQSWGPVKLPIFENLVGGSTPPPAEMGGGGGVHTTA